MQLGPYRLEAPLDVGPTGRAYRALDANGAECEVRLLDRSRADAAAWAALRRRLKLLDLAQHAAILRPMTVNLDGDTPYLALPPPRIWPPPTTLGDAIALGQRFASILAAAHRVGLVLGTIGPEMLHVAKPGELRVDFTGTLRELPHPLRAEDDVARLGKFLQRVSDSWPATGPDSYWQALIEQMQATRPEDRPLAGEVADRIVQADVYRTQVPAAEPAPPEASDDPPASKEEIAAMRTIDSLVPAGPDGAPRVGHRLGRFQLLDTLGEGAMGVVYRAEDLLDGQIVALKVLHASRAATAQGRRRFLKEGRLLAELDSPYVTRLKDINADGDCCFLAVEYVAGRNLREYLLSRGKLDEKAALGLIGDVARGLAAAHTRGIIHRDIKPDNILVLEQRDAAGEATAQAKVTDFGLARQVEQSRSLVLTQAGAMIGTPLYMAPEQFDGRPIDARADVYALGVTLFELLTGRPPFLADDFQGLMQKHLREPPPALERIEPNVSSATAELVVRALAKDPATRPADATAFLRQLERIQRGETVHIQTHPRLPHGAGRTLDYAFEWSLKASPAQLWPFVSNTERVNRAIGLPAVRYSFREDVGGGRRRMAQARVNGLKMEWEEHPFEWIEGQRMGILREFSRGPFKWFVSIVDLQPRPDGGTTLKQSCRVEPRGLFGRVAAAIELGIKARRSLTRLYQRIDTTIGETSAAAPNLDAFEVPTQLPAARQRRLQAGLERVLARGADAAATDLLGLYLSNAPAQELSRIRPLMLSRRFGPGESEMIDACLLAASEGLLTLQWDILCPLCRLPSARKDTLRELRDHENCQACAVDFQADFASAVELVFQVHPDIRQGELGMYCAGGPAHSPHVVAQVRVAAGERFDLDLSLTPGHYRVRGPQLPWAVELEVAGSGEARFWEVNLAANSRPRVPIFAAGHQMLTLTNDRAHDMMVRVERAAMRDDALTAARVTTLPRFRELFPGQVLAPGQLARASTLTLLLVQLADGPSLFEQKGDARGFQLLQAFLRLADARVRAEGGTLVKTAGEGIVTVFPELTAAVRAGLALAEAVAADPDTHELQLRAVVHRGLLMVATINDRLDYFGATVQIASRLLQEANAGELLLTAANASDPEVSPLLRSRPVSIGDLALSSGTRQMIFRIELRRD